MKKSVTVVMLVLLVLILSLSFMNYRIAKCCCLNSQDSAVISDAYMKKFLILKTKKTALYKIDPIAKIFVPPYGNVISVDAARKYISNYNATTKPSNYVDTGRGALFSYPSLLDYLAFVGQDQDPAALAADCSLVFAYAHKDDTCRANPNANTVVLVPVMKDKWMESQMAFDDGKVCPPCIDGVLKK